MDDCDHYLTYNTVCTWLCVCVCVCGYGRVYSLTSTSVWFQTFPPFPARVCVCLLRFKIASVSILQDPDCTRPVTLQGQMSCGDGASGLRARDGSLQQGGGDADFHCDISFTRQAFFFFLIQRAWSQVVLRRLSAQTPRAHKLLFDISTWVLFFLFFLKSSLRMWKNCLFFFFSLHSASDVSRMQGLVCELHLTSKRKAEDTHV